MSEPSHTQRLQEIVESALDLAVDEQVTFIEDASDGDDELRQEALRILGLVPTFVDDTVDGAGGAVDASERDTKSVPANERQRVVGTRVGPFTIEDSLDAGGMSQVYLARQASPERLVALKVMSRRASYGRVRDLAEARFQLESQLLAQLDHPCIARVISSGVDTIGGRKAPWIALEYVYDARTIDVYVADEALDTRERVALLRDVCDAIAHGHAQGVVHRDLKPGNVLVDAHGRARVIDFGIARLADDHESGIGPRTEPGSVVGTAAYVAPERLTDTNDRVRPTLDVYALGVLVTEVVTGRPRFASTLTTHAILASVRRDPVPIPSRSASGIDQELDWIVAHACDPDPRRRYASAAELRDDLGRYLAHEFLHAGPPTWQYRARTTMRRHRTAFAVAAGALALLLIALLGTSYGLIEKSRALAREQHAVGDRDAALIEREVALTEAVRARERAESNALLAIAARREAEDALAAESVAKEALAESLFKSEALASFYGRVFERAPLSGSGAEKYTLLDALNHTLQQLESGVGAPESDRALGAIYETTGHALRRLDQMELARAALRRALELYEREEGVEFLEKQRVRGRLIEVEYLVGDRDQARADAHEWLSTMRGQALEHPRDAESVGEGLKSLHLAAASGGDWELARDTYAYVEELRTAFPDTMLYVCAIVDYNHALVLSYLGRSSEAVEIARRAVDSRIAYYGDPSTRTIDAWAQYADAILQDGRPAEALAVLDERLAAYGSAPVDRDGRAIGVLDLRSRRAKALRHFDRSDEALAETRALLDIYLGRLGEGSWEVANTTKQLMETLGDLKHWDEMVALESTALARVEREFGKSSIESAIVLNAAGIAHLNLRALEEAEQRFASALTIATRWSGPTSNVTNLSRKGLTLARFERGDRRGAGLAAIEETIRALDDPSVPPAGVHERGELALRQLVALEMHDAAAEFAIEIAEHFDLPGSQEAYRAGYWWHVAGDSCQNAGQREEGRTCYRTAVARLESVADDSDIHLRASRFNVATEEAESGDLVRALELFDLVLAGGEGVDDELQGLARQWRTSTAALLAARAASED
ncbi:Serine/threonine-protein kinase PknB [Planctomycetes bacterium Pla163]|uniref:Serine/threonine-protein kinase PknB n=1 Tax=Rohdeia mirabilis TaxID=2528008 RepID=A0A518CXP2_9BACT|nr:Serine/threonine-protein kinase PknB [Planctomycetes bacterium Pla163]